MGMMEYIGCIGPKWAQQNDCTVVIQRMWLQMLYDALVLQGMLNEAYTLFSEAFSILQQVSYFHYICFLQPSNTTLPLFFSFLLFSADNLLSGL